MNVDLNAYKQFVFTLTSEPSKNLEAMVNRLHELNVSTHGEQQSSRPDINVPLFITSAMGMCSEAGEFMEIAKKCIWQGKEITEDVRFHLMRELGDQIFYWSQACSALGLEPSEVIAENVNKLQSRYPGGKFDIHHSENRRPGDL